MIPGRKLRSGYHHWIQKNPLGLPDPGADPRHQVHYFMKRQGLALRSGHLGFLQEPSSLLPPEISREKIRYA